jgi:hypothetical protein
MADTSSLRYPRSMRDKAWWGLMGLSLALLACQPAHSAERAPAAALAAAATKPGAKGTKANKETVGTKRPAPDAGSSDAATALAPPSLPWSPPAGGAFEECAHELMGPGCRKAFPEKLACPARFADVPAGAYCGIEGRTSAPAACHYAEASCTCKHVVYCGGVAPTPLQQMGMSWVCRPPLKAGDCPDETASGKRCTKPGQTCDYGGCGSATHCTCIKGKYHCDLQMRSTPP